MYDPDSDKYQNILKNSKAYVSCISNEIRRICTTLPSRSPGSQGESAAARDLASRLKNECGCSVTEETFEVHPGAFYGWLYLTNSFYLLALGSLFFCPVLSILLILAGLLIDVMEFMLYHRFVDRLFPKKESINITAVRPCSGTVEQRVFFNGHVDAAWEWPVNYRFGGIVFEVLALIPTVAALYYLILAVLLTRSGTNGVLSELYRPYLLYGFLFVPFILYMFFLWDRNRIVDGANDNLTGCLIPMVLLKAMEEEGICPEHTEFGVILTGSEEAGIRGASAWCRAHPSEEQDVPVTIISLDTIHDPRFLGVCRRDLNGFVRADEALASRILRVADQSGIPCQSTLVPFMGGSTDSAAFTKAGYSSVGITALNHNLEPYYHTRLDTWNNLNEDGIDACFRLCVNLAADFTLAEM